MGTKFKVLSIKQKLEVLNQLKNNNKTKKQLAEEYCCNICTINRILRNEEKIRKIGHTNVQCKRLRKGAHENVEIALMKWFNQARSKNDVITGPILLNKAKQIAITLNSEFKPNNGWLWRWQKRENIKFKKIHGAANVSNHHGAKAGLSSDGAEAPSEDSVIDVIADTTDFDNYIRPKENHKTNDDILKTLLAEPAMIDSDESIQRQTTHNGEEPSIIESVATNRSTNNIANKKKVFLSPQKRGWNSKKIKTETSSLSSCDTEMISVVQKLDNITERAQRFAGNTTKEDSFDHFGRYIASVLRDLPLKKACSLQLKMTNMAMNAVVLYNNH